MKAKGCVFGWSVFLAGAMAAFQAARAGDVEPRHRISIERWPTRVSAAGPASTVDESGIMIVPRVIVRERYIPRTQSRVEVVPEPQARVTSAPRLTRVPVPEIYAYREAPVGHDSLWYGDRYTDDWMYTLKPYNLADDFRLYNQASGAQTGGTAAPSPDVYGYVGEEEPAEPGPLADRASRRVTGIILELRLLDANGAGPPRVMLVVRTDEGVARRVQLPRDEARRLGLALGQRITAAGQPRIIDGVSVLDASRVEGVAVGPPTARPTTRTGDWYQGIILSTRVLQPVGLPERHLVATVALDDGNTMPVDLGPVANLPAGEIQPNDRVTLMARLTNVEGRPVLLADLLQIRGEAIQIRRE